MGYQELGTENGGKTMICPTFLNVGESNKVSLADLKVDGYGGAPSYDTKKKTWSGGCSGGKFVLNVLNPNGGADASYYWIHFGKKNNPDPIGPGWFADDVGTPIEGGADKVKFDAGDSFWTTGSGYKLVPAGAVNQFDISIATANGGKSAIGNCTPVDLKLNDLVVDPESYGGEPKYDTKKKTWSGGCSGGKFVLNILNPNGGADASYYWIHFGKKNNPDPIGPGWFADDVGTPIEGGADKVPVPAGQAFWTTGSGYKLIIPAPEL